MSGKNEIKLILPPQGLALLHVGNVADKVVKSNTCLEAFTATIFSDIFLW
jgi:hypothetical protein